MTDFKPFEIRGISESGFRIVPPYKAVRLAHLPRKAQWMLFGLRADVSARVLEPLTAITFRTRKAALGFLNHAEVKSVTSAPGFDGRKS